MVADNKPEKPKQTKKTETLRERAERASSGQPKVRRLKSTAQRVGAPLAAARRAGQREFYLPMPNNKLGQFLNKRRRATPKFFREAWAEMRQVEWPTAKETVRLTFAVFIFSLLFGIAVALVDYGLDKVFRKVFL